MGRVRRVLAVAVMGTVAVITYCGLMLSRWLAPEFFERSTESYVQAMIDDGLVACTHCGQDLPEDGYDGGEITR